MQPSPNEHTPSGTPLSAATDEEEGQSEQARTEESIPIPVAGAAVAPVQQEPTSEDDADVRLHETGFSKLSIKTGRRRFWCG